MNLDIVIGHAWQIWFDDKVLWGWIIYAYVYIEKDNRLISYLGDRGMEIVNTFSNVEITNLFEVVNHAE